MYIASNVMELGSESRFTSLILFHRYVRHFYVLVAASSSSDTSSSREMSESAISRASSMKPALKNNNKREEARDLEKDRKKIQNHLGKVAAACLYLGCKMEEEPRRIRDVINVSHVLQFSTWEDHDDDDDENNDQGDDYFDDSKPAASVELEQATEKSTKIIAETCVNPAISTPTATMISTKPSSNEKTTKPHTTNNIIPTATCKPLITIRESKHPPPLDESYWTAKENTVSIEQQVLRMLQFDTLVCHPHRCVLVVMDTLGFGTIHFPNTTTTTTSSSNSSTFLLTPQQSEQIIQISFQIINESSLDVTGAVLQFPVVTLTCASIALAADLFIEPGLEKNVGMNDATDIGEGDDDDDDDDDDDGIDQYFSSRRAR